MDKLRAGNHKLLIAVSLVEMFTTSKNVLKRVNPRSDLYFVLRLPRIVNTEHVRKMKR